MLLLLGALPACSGADAQRLQTLFGGPTGVQVVRDATVAEAWLLAGNQPAPGAKTPLAELAPAGEPVAVDDASLRDLRQALLDPGSYHWNTAKACIPDYGVRIRFAGAPADVDVLFCFRCDLLLIHHDRRWTGGEDFDPAADRLTSIAQRLFPDAAALR